jgi:hypothetical protein
MNYRLLEIKKTYRPEKKMMATFLNLKTNRTKTVHFGAAKMSDFTLHRDPKRKQRYLARHSIRENWNDPTSAGALSALILWNKPTLLASIADYKRRFGFSRV